MKEEQQQRKTTWRVTDNGVERDVTVEIPISRSHEEAIERLERAIERDRRLYAGMRRTEPNR